jgi:hypothetical protein
VYCMVGSSLRVFALVVLDNHALFAVFDVLPICFEVDIKKVIASKHELCRRGAVEDFAGLRAISQQYIKNALYRIRFGTPPCALRAIRAGLIGCFTISGTPTQTEVLRSCTQWHPSCIIHRHRLIYLAEAESHRVESVCTS